VRPWVAATNKRDAEGPDETRGGWWLVALFGVRDKERERKKKKREKKKGERGRKERRLSPS